MGSRDTQKEVELFPESPANVGDKMLHWNGDSVLKAEVGFWISQKLRRATIGQKEFGGRAEIW